MRHLFWRRVMAVLAVVVLATAVSDAAEVQKFPDIVAAKVTPRGGGVFDFDVTVSSPYDTAARYADAFRVKDGAGRVLGERILFHDHQSEQPFTRDLFGVTIPDGVRVVTIEGRDQTYGWGGKTLVVTLPGR